MCRANEHAEQARRFRLEGKSYRQIGRLMGFSEAWAWKLVNAAPKPAKAKAPPKRVRLLPVAASPKRDALIAQARAWAGLPEVAPHKALDAARAARRRQDQIEDGFRFRARKSERQQVAA